MSILTGELAESIADALTESEIPYPLTHSRPRAGASDDPWDTGNGSAILFECQGFVDTMTDERRDGTLVRADDIRVIIVAKSIETTPEVGDIITAQSRAYTVASVQSDPAGVLWDIRGRA